MGWRKSQSLVSYIVKRDWWRKEDGERSNVIWTHSCATKPWEFLIDSCVLLFSTICKGKIKSIAFGRKVYWYSFYENQYGGSSKIKNRTIICSSNSTSRLLVKRNKTTILKRFLNPHAQHCILHNSLSTDKFIRKTCMCVCVYICIWES